MSRTLIAALVSAAVTTVAARAEPPDPAPKVIPVSADLVVAPPAGPATAADFAARGRDYAGRKLWHLAAQDFSSSLRLDPKQAKVLVERGKAYFYLRRLDDSGADLEAALRLDPKLGEAYRGRAVLKLRRAAYGEEVLYPGDWHRVTEVVGALRDVEEAIRLDPADGKAFTTRCGIMALAGDYRRAVLDGDEAVRLLPDDPLVWSNSAAAHDRAGDVARAASDADRAVRLAPDDPKMWYHRGLFRARAGDWAGAVADATEAVRLDPAHSRALSLLAWTRATCPAADLRDGREAVRLATLSAGPQPDCQTCALLAAASAEAGNFAAAVRWQQRALDTDGAYLAVSGSFDLLGFKVVVPERKVYTNRPRRAKWARWLAGYEAGQPCCDPLPWKD